MKLTTLMDYLGKAFDRRVETTSYTPSILRLEYLDKAVETQIWHLEEEKAPPAEHQRILNDITAEQNKPYEMVNAPYRFVSSVTDASKAGCRAEWQSSPNGTDNFQTISEGERWFPRDEDDFYSELQYLGGKNIAQETYFRRVIFRGEEMVETSNVLKLQIYPPMSIATAPDTVFSATHEVPYDVTFPLPNTQPGTVHRVTITHLSRVTNFYLPASSHEMECEHVSGDSYKLTFHFGGWEYRVFAELKVLDEVSGELLSAAAYGPLLVQVD